jgi:hypothetical protein
MGAREAFAKMAGSLDSNRKIRKGGRDAREVYLWVLRQVALRDSGGNIPADDVLDFEHVADQLMCDPADARRGVENAVAVGLLAMTGGRCVVAGDDWRPAVSRVMETYVIQRGHAGPVKIGRSLRFAARLVELQTGCAETLEVLHLIEGDHEAPIHALCAAYRMRGEWFAPEAGLFSAIDAYLAGGA